METRQALLEHLKRNGPCGIRELMNAASVTENAVRHHLAVFQREGLIETHTVRDGVGRPARKYSLTVVAEGMFPKRYKELLDLILSTAQNHHLLDAIMDGVVEQLVEDLKPDLEGLETEDLIHTLLRKLDYGSMLGRLEATPGGWELKAYNCLYRDTGCRFEVVCNLLPRVITRATGLPAERPRCQRDGARACTFTIGRVGAA